MFSEVISNLKKINHLTNKEIAERSGLCEKTVGRILSGKVENPSLDILKGLSTCFDVPIDILAEHRSDRIIRREEYLTFQRYRFLPPERRNKLDAILEEAVREWEAEVENSYNMLLRQFLLDRMGKLSASDIVSLLPAIKEIRSDIDVDFDSYFQKNNNK